MRDYDLISDLKQVQTFLDSAKGVQIKKIKSPALEVSNPLNYQESIKFITKICLIPLAEALVRTTYCLCVNTNKC